MKTNKNRGVFLRLLAATVVVGLGSGVRADPTIYATSNEGNRLVSVDLATNAVTTIVNTTSPDSLIFDSVGRILYTNLGLGQLRRVNADGTGDTLIAGGFSDPADLTLEPGGNSVLVCDFVGGTISRVNLTTFVKTPFANPGGNPEGITYDNAGRLFANLGVRTGGADKFVARLDPITGAILSQSSNQVALDGLTFDPFSGKLYAALLNTNGIFMVDPNNLGLGSLLPNSGVPAPDGIEADGLGNLFIAGRGDSHIYQYNLITSVLTQKTFVAGLDDIAPVSGLGSNTPEPATMGVLAMGVSGLLMRRRH